MTDPAVPRVPVADHAQDALMRGRLAADEADEFSAELHSVGECLLPCFRCHGAVRSVRPGTCVAVQAFELALAGEFHPDSGERAGCWGDRSVVCDRHPFSVVFVGGSRRFDVGRPPYAIIVFGATSQDRTDHLPRTKRTL
jgi:hypothetical protein